MSYHVVSFFRLGNFSLSEEMIEETLRFTDHHIEPDSYTDSNHSYSIFDTISVSYLYAFSELSCSSPFFRYINILYIHYITHTHARAHTHMQNEYRQCF